MSSSSLSRGAWLATACALVAVLALLIPSRADSEAASSVTRPVQAGYLDAGIRHTCAVLTDRTLRCWGEGVAGRLGYGSDARVIPASAAPPVDMGGGRTARAIAAGDFHTCAILDDRSVKCWGFGANGRLGYGNTANISLPAAAPAVDLGPGRGAVAITAGTSHTCAILDTGSVSCWGNSGANAGTPGGDGRLGYGNAASIGDNEAPAAAGPVNLGGRTARAIAAGDFHTCAILDDGSMRCWGFGASGQLGNGGTANVGDNETPAAAGVVALPPGRTARAVSGGAGHTCAVLDDGSVRCWGFAGDGRLGYGNTAQRTTPGGPVALGAGRTATAVGVGEAHTCAILDTGAVRCWGFGGQGRLGYANHLSVGATPVTTPDTAGPVDLGAGRTARALTIGGAPTPGMPASPDEGTGYTCALLDDGTLRCWGYGGSDPNGLDSLDGRLGYGDGQQVAGLGFPSPGGKGPVPLGAMAGSLADVSVGMGASAAQVALGGTAGLGVTVRNAGPDAAGVALSVPPPAGLAYASVAPSQGGFAAGRWEVGVLGPGASASAQLSVRAAAAGTHTVAAQVAATSIFDRANEDDRAAVAIAVPGVATRRSPRAIPRGLGMKVVRFPKRGRIKRLTVSGVLRLPRTRPGMRCAGRVRVQALVGKRVVASTRAPLRRRAGACRYTAVLRPKAAKLRRARVVTVTARFLGNAQMRPRAARATKVRVR